MRSDIALDAGTCLAAGDCRGAGASPGGSRSVRCPLVQGRSIRHRGFQVPPRRPWTGQAIHRNHASVSSSHPSVRRINPQHRRRRVL